MRHHVQRSDSKVFYYYFARGSLERLVRQPAKIPHVLPGAFASPAQSRRTEGLRGGGGWRLGDNHFHVALRR